MAYPVTAGSIMLVTVVGSDDKGGATINDFHYKDLGSGGITDGANELSAMIAMLSAPGTAFRTKFLNCCDAHWTWSYIQAQWVYPTRFVPARSNLGVPGNVAGNAPPPVLTMPIKRLTDQAGKKFRGRFFVPAVPLSFIDPATGSCTPLGLVAYNNLANESVNVIAPVGSTRTYQPVIFHRADPLSPTPIRSAIANPDFHSLRRRLPQRGI